MILRQYKKLKLIGLRTKYTLGIRKEEKNQWERRAPIIPKHVELMVKKGVNVEVQSCSKRVFTDYQYEKAGAKIVKEFENPTNIIIGVKEPSIEKIQSKRHYLLFSHTHKGQTKNIPLLYEFINKNCSLTDYELLVDENNKRSVAFGHLAGCAGVVDGLHGLGLKLLGRGFASPLLELGMAYSYPSLNHAKASLEKLKKPFYESLDRPLIIGIIGSGNVAKGAKEVLERFSSHITTFKEFSLNPPKGNGVVVVQIEIDDYIIHKNGSFNYQDYLKNPSNYLSTFHQKVLPQLDVLINCSFWSFEYPKLISNSQLLKFGKRLIMMWDIGCEINGPFEFIDKITTIDDPFLHFNPKLNSYHRDWEDSDAISCLVIDNLPAGFSKDSSDYFSEKLTPLLLNCIKQLPEAKNVFDKATILKEGHLVPRFKHLIKEKDVKKQEIKVKNNEQKRIVVFGSGLVAEPCIAYLVSIGIHVTIASNQEQPELVGKNRTYVQLDISNHDVINHLISDSNLVISLLPAVMHVQIAELCLTNKKHLVTASYISPEMKKLNKQAKDLELIFLNEIGLDPGIDHLSAMKLIDEIQTLNGKIESFVSWCGGLTAPQFSNNPLRYKFSWSPKGAILASQNSARFRISNKEYEIEGNKLLSKRFINLNLIPAFNLEGLANRNSLNYISTYGLNSDIPTMFRGTLRYQGYSDLLNSMFYLGFLSAKNIEKELSQWSSINDYFKFVLSNQFQLKAKDIEAQLNDIVNKFNPENKKTIIDAFKWLGFLDNSKFNLFQKLQSVKLKTIQDVFLFWIENLMKYEEDEQDAVILSHEINYLDLNAEKRHKTSLLVLNGEYNGYSAMAKTVGLPVALAAELILKWSENSIPISGVLAPIDKMFYIPLLESLEEHGIRFVERDLPGHCNLPQVSHM